MRKILAFSMALLLILGLIGCGSSTTTTTKATTASVAPTVTTQPAATTAAATAVTTAKPGDKKDWKIAVIPKNANSQWGIRLGEGVKAFNADKGMNAIYKGPATVDSASQIRVIEDMIAQKVDAICVIPLDVAACEPVLKKARDAGIVVVSHEASKLKNKDYDLEAFKNNEFGAYCLDKIAEQVGSKTGDFIMMVGVFTNGSHNEWADAAEAQVKKYPNIKFIQRVESKESFEGSFNVATELIKKYPNLIAIQGSSSADLPGICNAIEQAGLSGKIAVGGLGIPNNVKQYVASGTLKSFSLWDPKNATYAMCNIAVKALEGKKVVTGDNMGKGYEKVTVSDQGVVVGSDMLTVTKDNIANFNF